MPLPAAREGDTTGIHVYTRVSHEGTLADPETIIWASIRHVCSSSYAEQIAWQTYGIKRKSDRQAVARNAKLYIQQSTEFYESARGAKANTAPLMYYYSFLNLAKALCEFRTPYFHEQNECYRHGLNWRPNPAANVDLLNEHISVGTRGVWHALWECMMHKRCPAANPMRLRVLDLFAFCPENSIELMRSVGKELRSLDLEKAVTVYDTKRRLGWIRFSVAREDFRRNRISAPAALRMISTPRSTYREVKAEIEECRTFESTNPVRVRPRQYLYDALGEDIRGLNLFTHIGMNHELNYFIPVQNKLPLQLPQLVVLYTILFWLGSLVRYDPHSVASLMESPGWILLDGFMSQSRLWLLEQFEWAIYQAETTLWLSR